MKIKGLSGNNIRKGGLVGLGLVAILIGALQKVIGFALSRAYEALERRNEHNIKKGSAVMARRREGRDEISGNFGEDPQRSDYRRQMEEARRRYEIEIRASRDVQREQRKAIGRVQGAWRLAAIGSGLFLGSVVGNELGALAGIGFGLMIGGTVNWIGALVASRTAVKVSKAGAVPVAQRAQIEAPKVLENALPQGRAELVQQILGDAATSLRALDTTMSKLRHPDSVSSVARIVAVGNRVMQNVAANPEKLSIAQRVFTYYCPETVKVAEALAKLEGDANPDVERITGTQGVLRKLEVLFERTELELKADESKELDIDLRLLDQSIESDLRTKV